MRDATADGAKPAFQPSLQADVTTLVPCMGADGGADSCAGANRARAPSSCLSTGARAAEMM